MDQYFPTISNDEIHHLDGIKTTFKGWIGEVSPEEVEEWYAIVHQKFWGVWKTIFQAYPISTVRMFSRFL